MELEGNFFYNFFYKLNRSSDPFVRIRINGFPDQKTSYIGNSIFKVLMLFLEKTLTPVWNEKLTFPKVFISL